MKVPENVTRAFGRAVLQTKKNSPHIFFAAGIAGVVGSTVLACRATLKLEKTLDEIKQEIEKVKSADVLTEQETNRLLALKYGRGSVKVIRLYAPSLVLGAASVAALTGSHVQLNRRNNALSATLALVSQAYDDYRDRVREEIGEDKELDIYRGVTEKEVEIDGKKQLVKVADPNRHSPYARWFDPNSIYWEKNAELNRYFVQCQQNYFNHQLQAVGHVFLNDVYEKFGLEHTTPGAVVGWLRDGDGDGYIDFGLYEERNLDFVNGREINILLDFNVDGTIYDKI